MAANPHRKISPGQVLTGIPAQAYNGWQDVADAFREGRLNGLAGTSGDGLPFGSLVRIKNGSGTARAQFDVLQVSGVIYEPTDGSGASFREQRGLTGAIPDADDVDAFAVLQEPIRTNGIARALISGVTPCRVHVNDAAHRFADLSDGTAEHLESTLTGRAQILWKGTPDGSNIAEALVLLGSNATQCVVGTANNNYLYNTTATFTVGGSTVQSLVTNGFIQSGASYRLLRRDNLWFILDPDLVVSGTADSYYYHGQTGNFTVGGATVPALIRHGMTFSGTTYDLAWDGTAGRFLVLHPDLRFRGVANAAIAAGATNGSVSIYYWNGTAFADTAQDLTDVLAGPNVALASGAIVWCEFVVPTYSRAQIYQAQFTCP